MGRQGRTDVFVITDAKDVAGRPVQAVAIGAYDEFIRDSLNVCPQAVDNYYLHSNNFTHRAHDVL